MTDAIHPLLYVVIVNLEVGSKELGIIFLPQERLINPEVELEVKNERLYEEY